MGNIALRAGNNDYQLQRGVIAAGKVRTGEILPSHYYLAANNVVDCGQRVSSLVG